VFVVLAGLVYFLLRNRWEKNKFSLRMFWVLVIAFVPLMGLMILWKGPAPPSGISRWRTVKSALFHPAAITLYVGLLFAYIFPIVIWKWNRFVFSQRTHLIIVACSFLYFLFPVQSSEVSLEEGTVTVGLFHRALVAVFSSHSIIHIVFYVCFLLGLHLLVGIGKESVLLIRQKNAPFSLLLYLIVFAFFIVMPFSYQLWEKYILPLVPIVSLWLLLKNNNEPISQTM